LTKGYGPVLFNLYKPALGLVAFSTHPHPSFSGHKALKCLSPGSPTHVRCWIQGVQTRWVFRRLQSSVGPYFSAVITDVNHEQSWMIIDEESKFAAWLQIGHQFLPIGSCQRTLRLLWMQ